MSHLASIVSLLFYNLPHHILTTKNPPTGIGGLQLKPNQGRNGLLLPSALLVTIRFEPLAAFVFRHLQTSFLLKVSHGVNRLMNGQRATGLARCKA